MTRNRQTRNLCVGALAAILVLAVTSARGAILVYEPFDYAVSNVLSGASGSTEIGFIGTWKHDWVMTGYVFPAGPNGAGPSWDGVVDNVPTAPLTIKYAGGAPSGFWGARMWRQLSSDAGTLADADGVLWLSAVYHFGSRTEITIGLGSGACYYNDGERVKDVLNKGTSVGTSFMGGSDPNSIDLQTLTVAAWTNAANYGAVASYDTFPQGSLPPFSEDCIVVLKYTFGEGTTSTVDTVEGVVFSETDALSEAAFNSHPDKVSASCDSSLVDESTFNVLSYELVGAPNTIDEIRIGDTFDDVVGLAAGPVDVNVSAVVASPAAVPADGSTPATITVTLRDAFWIPVTNHTVSLSGSTGNATITTLSATTDASGEATFEVTSSTVETEVFTATDTTASVVITQTASVQFADLDTTAPPTPTFVLPLGPVGYDWISVAANPVTDPEGKDVEYRFSNITLGTDSGWLSSPSNTFVGLDSDTTYSFTVEARDTALTPNVSAPSSSESATTAPRPQSSWTIPDSTANVLVWLDASDTATLTTNGSGQVSQWDDKSGNGNHMLQASTSWQPKSGSRTVLGLNVVDFDGAGDRMQEAANAFGPMISNTMVFVVVETDSPDSAGTQILRLTDGDYWTLYSQGYDAANDFRFNLSGRYLDGNNDWMHLRNYATTVPGATLMQGRTAIFGLYDSPAMNSIQLWIDAVLADQWVHYGSATPVGPTTTSTGIELAYNGVFDGAFAEVVIIDGIIATEERQEIEGYLAWKWGGEYRLPVDHPYYDLPPQGPPPAGTIMYLR